MKKPMSSTNGRSSGIRLTKKFDDGVLNVYLTFASLKMVRSSSLGPLGGAVEANSLPPASSVKLARDRQRRVVDGEVAAPCRPGPAAGTRCSRCSRGRWRAAAAGRTAASARGRRAPTASSVGSPERARALLGSLPLPLPAPWSFGFGPRPPGARLGDGGGGGGGGGSSLVYPHAKGGEGDRQHASHHLRISPSAYVRRMRQCSRPGCAELATVTLTYQYDERRRLARRSARRARSAQLRPLPAPRGPPVRAPRLAPRGSLHRRLPARSLARVSGRGRRRRPDTR